MDRIAFIDFEASSLDENSYPIEVGIAIYEGGSTTSWGCLIRPTSTWRSRDAWSRSSERVHGISRDTLDQGLEPREVAKMISKMLADFTVTYCDGGTYDQHWLHELREAGGVDFSFELRDVGSLFVKPGQHPLYLRLKRELSPRHRAEDDAERLLALTRRVLSPQG